jgi:hypothetical protein
VSVLARRLLAIAVVLDGASREEAATLCADFVAKVFLHWQSKILLAVDATFA